ncbi:MAG: hypothetical protein IPK63_07445 [Candidatus Competibacteraceae bacterium]|nr:hypothetical protein [Candidatus Competibacteraceae bacterium]
MTQDEQRTSALVAACAREVSTHILAYAREAQLDSAAFLVNVAALLAASALAAQPEDQRLAASRHIQSVLRLVHCVRDEEEDANEHSQPRFVAPKALQ